MSVITARKRKERYETLNKAKFISLISTAVLATASSGVFADETTPVSDGSTSPAVSVTAPVPTDKSTDKAPDTSSSHVSDGTSGVTAPTTPVTPTPPTTPKSEEKPSTSETVTPTDKAPDTSASHVSDGTSGVTAPTTPVTPTPPTTPKSEEKPSTSETVTPTDKAPDTSASHVSDGTSGVTAPTTPVTPAPPTTPKSEEKPSTSETVKSKTTASNSQIPDPNKVTDKAPEAKPSTEKQAVATETEALPHTGDDTALTVSLTSLGAFLIAAGLGFLPKRKKD